ncbi:glucose-6-phosphate exchanger SLC37A4-like [Argiope bruennichi]|uniref:Glucose-6-phosphate exchanger SLC37A4 like protein n=1 Tax=Argiope bruennichi TaxID=94029 RepID=A0A8T0E474_ARGBR|nr:glucose-6-phosphate exchanger SLC37A4-like [Argiope bruennichi]KAF8765126.1 Glucose-6-phosphate exchanger SLC37A4 like protein [Argiope bruennichi]
MEGVYVTLFVCYASYTYNRKSVSFVTPSLIEEGLDASHAGLIISCQNAAFAISKFLAGVLSDRTNPRLLFTSGLLLSGFTTLLFSSSSSVGVFCALWFANGLAQGCGWPSCVKFIRQRASPSQLGRLWSLLSSGNNLSGCLSPILSAYLVTHYGWRTSVSAAGVTSLILGSFSLVALDDAEQSKQKLSNENKKHDQKLSGNSVGSKNFADLLRDPFLWLISAGFLVVFCTKTTLVDWGQLFLIEERRLTQREGSAFTSSVESGGLFGRIAAGYLTDYLIKKLGEKPDPVTRSRTRLHVAMIFMLLSIATLYALHSTVKESSSLVWILLLGFVLGSCVYGPITIFGIVSTESAPSHLSGSSNAIASLAGNVGAMISGFPFCYVAKIHGWTTVFFILEVAMSTVLCVMTISWNRHPKTSIKSKKD